MTPERSLYLPTQPSASESSGEGSLEENTAERGRPLEALNKYLRSHSKSPIRSQLSIPWQNASERSKRYYIRKAGQAATAVVQDFAPDDSAFLFQEVSSSRVIRSTLCIDKDSDYQSLLDETLMDALTECYHAADSWATRRQILSVMADKVSFKQLQRWIPDLTKHRYTEAKRHCLVHGRGAPIQLDPLPRMRVPTAKIDHFIAFITSDHVAQDLPFGERTITLSTRETIKVPNVIRTLLPERTVKQYSSYCKESGFHPLGRTILLRILKTCAASVRKSLQGLDYISSSGAEAFDELSQVAETLGDVGQGMGWVKTQQQRLRESKRYLKSDYKV